MALYVGFYRNFGQIVAESLDSNYQISTNLVAVEPGSIKAIIEFGKNIPKIAQEALYSSANRLALSLCNEEVISTPTQLDKIAKNIDDTVNSIGLNNSTTEHHINRRKLGKALEKLSKANEKLEDEETIEYNNGAKIIPFNTKFRMTADALFESEEEEPTQIIQDTVSVIGPMNFGDAPWHFESNLLLRPFRAPVLDKDWLESYQNGFILPIGPRDSLSVILEYKIKKKSNGKIHPFDFKIRKIKKEIRGNYDQKSFDAFN